MITAVVALVGIHARDASHSPPPFIPPAFSSPAVAGGLTRGPILGMGVGIPCPHSRALQQMNHLGTSTVIVAGQRLLVPFTLGITGIC